MKKIIIIRQINRHYLDRPPVVKARAVHEPLGPLAHTGRYQFIT
jgi:hypothetical protein